MRTFIDLLNSPANAGDLGSIPGSGRSPGIENSNLLQYSCLGNPMDRQAWQATVPRVAQESDTTQQLNSNSNKKEAMNSTGVWVVRWPKYWTFSFSIIPSKEIPGLISFRMDWLDPLAVQGALKSLLQHHSSKASILQHSAFFSPTLTSRHDYQKNHSLDQTDLCWQSNVSAF